MVIVLKVFVLSKHVAKIQYFFELTNILPTFFVRPQKSQRVTAPCDLYLLLQEHCFSPIVLWPYREMQPVVTITIPLNKDFVIVLLGLVGIIHQDHRISHRLLNAIHSDIHGAPRQMIARRRTAHLLIQLRTPISAADYDGGIFFPS